MINIHCVLRNEAGYPVALGYCAASKNSCSKDHTACGQYVIKPMKDQIDRWNADRAAAAKKKGRKAVAHA